MPKTTWLQKGTENAKTVLREAEVRPPNKLTRISKPRTGTKIYAEAGWLEGVENLTLKDCVLVSSLAAAESIYANAPTDVRLYGSNMANKAKHADVTFLTGGSRFEVNGFVEQIHHGNGGPCSLLPPLPRRTSVPSQKSSRQPGHLTPPAIGLVRPRSSRSCSTAVANFKPFSQNRKTHKGIRAHLSGWFCSADPARWLRDV